MWHVFKASILEAQDRFIPVRRNLAGKLLKPIWFNSNVRNGFNEKKNAFRQFKSIPSAESKLRFIQARKKLKRVIREAKRVSEIRLANECEGDLKRFFGFYKLNRHDPRIGKIEKDGQVYHDENLKVNAFREQFSSVFTDECLTNIPIDKGNNGDALKTHINRFS